MNYRHAFHAGGFADVIKHIVLVRILTHLQDKPAAFRVIDTHAGAGLYDLAGDEARRGGEWLTGIARVMQARVVDLDGWVALPAFVPPNERRGLVLIDPPYEQKDEFERLGAGFAQAFAKWPTGSYLLWYPVKSRRATDSLARHVTEVASAGTPPGKCLRLEFSVAPQTAGAALASAGLLIVNPPWTLAGELRAILPELEKPLGRGGAGRFRLETPKP